MIEGEGRPCTGRQHDHLLGEAKNASGGIESDSLHELARELWGLKMLGAGLESGCDRGPETMDGGGS